MIASMATPIRSGTGKEINHVQSQAPASLKVGALGRRSPDWIKTKHVHLQEVVIGGWRPGEGRRAGSIGSLLMGIPTTGGLAYCGRVSTGFTGRMLNQLAAQLQPLERNTPPFTTPIPADIARIAHWAEPLLVGEVSYTEWITDGTLRHPSWRGLRPDKTPDQVRKEVNYCNRAQGFLADCSSKLCEP